MVLVFSTSNGVVTPAEIAPAMHPQTADSDGKRGRLMYFDSNFYKARGN